jgi:hypothetical protein
MMKRISILFIFHCCIICCYGRECIITGKVKDAKGEPYAQVSVTLKQLSDSSLVAYTYTDNTGNYKLSYQGEENELLLTVASLGIATQTKKIPNKNQTVDFIIKEETFQLKEVVIKPEKIYYSKDTINYLVSAFTDENDTSIGNVLKKMPGIAVAESGQISYQGRPINKFYIENMDLLNGRYGIATQNIAPKDVSTVQVLENHQPIKALDSIRISDRAAINLKLKEGAKGVLNITAQLGLGASPLLWDNELTAMYFTRKRQHIATYKTNNSGNDLTKELRSFDASSDLSPGQFTSIHTPSPPNISKNRYLFNNSNAVTSNNLFNIGKDKELNFNVIYYNDYEKRQSEARSSYYIPGNSLLVIDENIQSAVNTDRLETEIRLNENSTAKYLNNLLDLESSWESGKGTIRTGSDINQQLYRPSVKVHNTFHLVKNSGKSGFEIFSRTGFRNSPQNLIISPGLYADRLNDGIPYSVLRQDVHANTLVSKNGFSFLSLFPIGKVMVNPVFGFDLEVNDLRSELSPRDLTGNALSTVPDSLKNNLNRAHYKIYTGINANYKMGKFHINTHFPVSCNFYRLDNKIAKSKNEQLNKWYLEPSLSMRYAFSFKIDVNANASFYNGINNIYELYSGYIVESYRYLNHYNSRFAGSHGNLQSLSIAYKDIITMFFASARVSRNYIKNSVIGVRNFDDNLMLTSFIRMPQESNTIGASGKIGKSFDWKKLSIGLDVNRMINASQQIRQDNWVNYRTDILNFSATLSAVPFSFLIVSLESVWQERRSQIERQEAFAPIRSCTNTANFDFKLIDKLRIGAKSELYYNNAMKKDKYLYFSDICLNYTWKQVRFELDWSNILNTKNYTTAFYSDLNEYHFYYLIRPASIQLKIKFKLR